MTKRLFILIPLLFSLIFSQPLKAQEQPGEWPEKMSSVSGYAVLGLGAHMNFSYDFLKKGEKIFYGFTGGVTVMVMEGVTFGPHLTYDMMFGRKDHHLDVRIGTAIPLDSDVTFIPFVPLVSLAYRYQKPGSNKYLRVGLNTGGLGFGGGVLL